MCQSVDSDYDLAYDANGNDAGWYTYTCTECGASVCEHEYYGNNYSIGEVVKMT